MLRRRFRAVRAESRLRQVEYPMPGALDSLHLGSGVEVSMANFQLVNNGTVISSVVLDDKDILLRLIVK